jgi:hypothetical protein
MKNKLNILLVLPLIIIASMGCGLIEKVQKTATGDNSNTAVVTTNSNKSITDRAIEEVADGETTGVSECDEAIKFVNDQLKNPDDNFITKAGKDYLAGQIKRKIKEAIIENQTDKKEAAKQCADAKKSFEKSLKEEQQDNKNAN